MIHRATRLALRPRSDEEDIPAKLQQLARLQAELIDRELFLTNLHLEIRAFEVRYMREVGYLYLELDEWNRKIAKGHTEELQIDIAKIRQELRELLGEDDAGTFSGDSRRSARSFSSEEKDHSSFVIEDEPGFAAETHPSMDLKATYREVAKRVHPDFATDERDRQKREVLMKQANSAYQRGDLETLKSILEKYEESTDWTGRADGPSALPQIRRQISRIRIRLERIEQEIIALLASDVGDLKQRVDAACARGDDLLAEMAESVRRRIEAARERFCNRGAPEGQT